MAFSILVSTLNGANLVHDLGYLESGLTSCLEGILLCDEVVDMVKRTRRGVDISEETLALETIERAGPGGHFVADEHTRAHFRQTQWYPRWLDRKTHRAWVKSPFPDLRRRLNRKVREILAQDVPSPLSREVQEGIEAVLAREGIAVS